MKTFGLWLREKRIDMGMTINDFAKVCNLSYVTISNLERGRKKAGIYATKKIANALQVEYLELRNIMKTQEQGGVS